MKRATARWRATRCDIPPAGHLTLREIAKMSGHSLRQVEYALGNAKVPFILMRRPCGGHVRQMKHYDVLKAVEALK